MSARMRGYGGTPPDTPPAFTVGRWGGTFTIRWEPRAPRWARAAGKAIAGVILVGAIRDGLRR